MQMRFEVFVIEIEADVAIKIAVVVIAGIALDGTPHLLGRLGIAGQASDVAARNQDGCINAETRPRLGEQHGMRIGEEIAYPGVLQLLLNTRSVAALRQPDAP